MKQFNIMAYTSDSAEYPLTAVPSIFWRKIEILYPGGNAATLVYDHANETEYRELILAVQTRVPQGSKIIVTLEDGTSAEAEVFTR